MCCYRLRLREKAERDWSYVDNSGHFREDEVTFAWTSRLVPLKVGLWVNAFGDFDHRKSSTPGAAVICELCTTEQGVDTVKVRFKKPSSELSIGAHESMPLTCTQSPQLLENKVQIIPVDWIEAVWFVDGLNYLKGSPMTSFVYGQGVVLTPSEGKLSYSVKVKEEQEPIPNIVAQRGYLSAAGIETIGTKTLEIETAMQLACMFVHGLRVETTYKFAVQALTPRGWTEWSEADFEMPRTEYRKVELVREKSIDVFYKSSLLPQAFFKEYEKCWGTLEEAIPDDRFSVLKATVHSRSSTEHFDPKRSLVGRHGGTHSQQGANQ